MRRKITRTRFDDNLEEIKTPKEIKEFRKLSESQKLAAIMRRKIPSKVELRMMKIMGGAKKGASAFGKSLFEKPKRKGKTVNVSLEKLTKTLGSSTFSQSSILTPADDRWA